MATHREVDLGDGRTLVVHDTGPTPSSELTVLWHHGSPQTGALLDPVVDAAQERNVRLVSYARPSYGGSTPDPGRTVASAAEDVRAIMEELGIDRFATMGGSGGGPHALACGALLPDRVIGVVCLSGLAPLTHGFEWFAGMTSPGGLQAVAQGRAARAEFATTEEFDETQFIDADWAALSGSWQSLGADAGRAGTESVDGLIDDDVAFTRPWGFGLVDVTVPVLLVQGGADRVVPPAHADWLLAQCPDAQLWLRPHDGHISVLNGVPLALDWLRQL